MLNSTFRQGCPQFDTCRSLCVEAADYRDEIEKENHDDTANYYDYNAFGYGN